MSVSSRMLRLSSSYVRSVLGGYSVSVPVLVTTRTSRRVFRHVAHLRLRYQPVLVVGVGASARAAVVLRVLAFQWFARHLSKNKAPHRRLKGNLHSRLEVVPGLAVRRHLRIRYLAMALRLHRVPGPRL